MTSNTGISPTSTYLLFAITGDWDYCSFLPRLSNFEDSAIVVSPSSAPMSKVRVDGGVSQPIY